MNNYILIGAWLISLILAYKFGLKVQQIYFQKKVNEIVQENLDNIKKNTLFIYIEEHTSSSSEKEYFAYENETNKFIVSAQTMDELASKLTTLNKQKYIKCVKIEQIEGTVA